MPKPKKRRQFMNKLKKILLSVIILSVAACGNDAQSLKENEIYLFYQNSCPHCHDAFQYFDSQMPNLKMNRVNVASREGWELLLKCADKFNLDKNQLGTPLICMGDTYILGWGGNKQRQFEAQYRNFKLKYEK